MRSNRPPACPQPRPDPWGDWLLSRWQTRWAGDERVPGLTSMTEAIRYPRDLVIVRLSLVAKVRHLAGIPSAMPQPASKVVYDERGPILSRLKIVTDVDEVWRR